MITALTNGAVRHGGQAGRRARTPVVSDHHVAPGRACRIEYLQRVVDQRADVIDFRPLGIDDGA